MTPENTSDEGGPLVGVLALQGAFARHIEALARSGASTREVRQPKHLDGLDALVIPGGESSTISKLLDSSGLRPMVQDLLDAGLPVFGTCAGMILLASAVLDGRSDQASFGAIDMAVRRNGYGRQINSFEADLAIPAIGESPFRAVFIRAPKVESVGDGVEVLAAVEGVPVLCKQGAVLVAALTDDHRLHQVFVAGL